MTMDDASTPPKITTPITPEEREQAEWERTLSRLGIQEVDITSVRDSDILYLFEQWQFLQVVESGGEVPALEKPQILTAKSGWSVVNYGDAMATSPGKWIFRGGYL